MALEARLKPIVGNWAGGASFFDRVDETADLVRRLEAGASVSLAAPRRVGKTSLLREVARQLDAKMTCIFVDLEDIGTPEDAIAEIAEKAERHRAVRSRVRAWAAALIGNAELDLQFVRTHLRDVVRADWQTRGNRLIAELCQTEQPVVLFLDELPVLVAGLLDGSGTGGGRNPADLFLSWLRRLTQEHPDKLRIVVTGSIGLAPMVARAGLSSTLNVYQPMRLGPWSHDTAVAALLALSAYAGLGMSEAVAGSVLDHLGIGVPFHVQLVHQTITDDARRRKATLVTEADVDRAWREVARELAKDLPDPLDAARAVLATLEHDGYLGRGDAGWYFPNRLLHAWWADQYGSFGIDE